MAGVQDVRVPARRPRRGAGLLVCFGGAGIAALGDARERETHCARASPRRSFDRCRLFGGLRAALPSQEESVGAALYRTTPYACALVAFAAILPEIAQLTYKCLTLSTYNGAFPRYDGGARLIAPSCFYVVGRLPRCASKRFSALIVAVFVIRGASRPWPAPSRAATSSRR